MKNFAWWFEKVYAHTNTWMAGRDSRRQAYHRKMRFTAGLIWRVSVIRLWPCTGSLEYHGKRPLLSRYLLKNRCIAVSGCVWNISQYVLKKLQIRFSTFLHRTRISMAVLLKTAAEYYDHEKSCEHKKRWDCKVCPEFRLELLTDIDILLMFEKGIRGGITQAVKRYARANNKYMNDLYNLDEVSIFL